MKTRIFSSPAAGHPPNKPLPAHFEFLLFATCWSRGTLAGATLHDKAVGGSNTALVRVDGAHAGLCRGVR